MDTKPVFCTKCGKKQKARQAFCTYCGAAIEHARANAPKPEDSNESMDDLMAKIPEMEAQVEQLRAMKGIPGVDNALKILEGQLGMLKSVAKMQADPSAAAKLSAGAAVSMEDAAASVSEQAAVQFSGLSNADAIAATQMGTQIAGKTDALQKIMEQQEQAKQELAEKQAQQTAQAAQGLQSLFGNLFGGGAIGKTSMPMQGTEEAIATTKAQSKPVAPHEICDTAKGNPVFQPLAGGLKWIDDNHVEFGSYPQMADGGVKKILWRVLDSSNGQLLLISEFILDSKKWHDTPNYSFKKTGKPEDIAAAITAWEHCDLRKWLNDYFYHNAFNTQEKNQIAERLNGGNGAYIHKDYKPLKGKKENIGAIGDDTYERYEERGCRDTRDKVFLLNVAECIDYFKKETYIVPQTLWPANTDRFAKATDYANAKTNLNPFNGETWDSTGKGAKRIKVGTEFIGDVSWWLRNIGCNDLTLTKAAFHMSQVATVYMGAIFTGGQSYTTMNQGVRPVILVNTAK